MNVFTRAFASMKFKAIDKSPELLIVGGVASLIAAGVCLWKARPKYEAVLDEHAEREAKIQEALERTRTEEVVTNYTEKEAAADRRGNYMKTAVGFVKTFAPVVLFSLGAVACFVGSSAINKKRYLAMAAAYTTVSKNNAVYEKMLATLIGPEALAKLKAGEAVSIDGQPIVMDNDGGDSADAKEPEKVSLDVQPNWVLFDGYSKNFEKDRVSNETYLEGMQKEFDRLLQERTTEYAPGYITLNEVLNALDLPKTEKGQMIGWSNYPDPKLNKLYGAAGFVSFGIKNVNSEAHNMAVRNPFEPALWLEMNVDKAPLLGRGAQGRIMWERGE